MTHPTPTPATPERRDIPDPGPDNDVTFFAPIGDTGQEVCLEFAANIRDWQQEYGDPLELVLMIPNHDDSLGEARLERIVLQDRHLPALIEALASVMQQARAAGSLASATA